MDTPSDTVVYADEHTASVFWLQGDALFISPLLSDGTFATDDAGQGARNVVANDLAAHDKRVEAALHRVAGAADLAEKAEREARFYDGCADRDEAACMGHRELGGVKHPVAEGRIARMTVEPGLNRAPLHVAA